MISGDLAQSSREKLHRHLQDAIVCGDIEAADAIAAEFRRRADILAADLRFDAELLSELEAVGEKIAVSLFFGSSEQRAEACNLLALHGVTDEQRETLKKLADTIRLRAVADEV